MQDTQPASSHHQGPANDDTSAFGTAATGASHAVQFPYALPPLPKWKNFKAPTFPPSTLGGSTWSSQVEGGQGGVTCFSPRASTVPGSTRPPSTQGGSAWSSQVEGGQGGVTCFTPRASAVPGSNRWGMPQDGQNCVGWSAPTAAHSWFQPLRNLGGKDMGPASHGGPEGAYGNADCDVGDAWMGGVADIAGTQYGGCSSADSDGEFNVQGRDDVSNNDGSQRRAPGGGEVVMVNLLQKQRPVQRQAEGVVTVNLQPKERPVHLQVEGVVMENLQQKESPILLIGALTRAWGCSPIYLRKTLCNRRGEEDRKCARGRRRGLSAVTEDDDTGAGSGSPAPRRREGSDGGEWSKSARMEGGGGSARRSRSQSSAEGNRGGSFADFAHALVESNDRQADKLAGSFANVMDGINNTLAQGNVNVVHASPLPHHMPIREVKEVVGMAGDFALTHKHLIEQAHKLARKRGVLFPRTSDMVDKIKRLQGELESSNTREAMALSRAEVVEVKVGVLREEVQRLHQLLAAIEDGESVHGKDNFVSTLSSPGSGHSGPVSSVVVSVSHSPRESAPRSQPRRRVATPPACIRTSPNESSANVNRRDVTAVADQLRRVMAIEQDHMSGSVF
ncbi:hypothetical protein CBR_g19486 [Chara braunii]|uniref:Uncharacterized protein n=1 Tax=Chara braunii TaxID=69332 RepID=A0A388KYF2_CHABU|nr:hypothetical protein CBR_g19486 [Chara braunii]|eukprot:GBG74973.1 hypothetical protein CBR_g19486 [Chara braunii]